MKKREPIQLELPFVVPKDNEALHKWRASKERHPDAMALVRGDDFYSTFNSDAEIVAKVLKEELFDRGNYLETIFSVWDLDTVLPALIRKGHRVAII